MPRAPCLAMEGKREEPAEQMPAVGAVGVLRWAACRGGGKACGSHLKSGDLPPLWGLCGFPEKWGARHAR